MGVNPQTPLVYASVHLYDLWSSAVYFKMSVSEYTNIQICIYNIHMHSSVRSLLHHLSFQ